MSGKPKSVAPALSLELLLSNVATEKEVVGFISKMAKDMLRIKYVHTHKYPYTSSVSPSNIGYKAIKRVVDKQVTAVIPEISETATTKHVTKLIKEYIHNVKLDKATKAKLSKGVNKMAAEYLDNLTDAQRDKLILKHLMCGK